MGAAGSKHEEFWEACGFGHPNIVKQYLQSKVIDVNWRNHSQGNSTTLHLACQGKIEILKILLEAGSHVNAKDDSGNLAIHLAAMNGHSDIVEELISSDSQIDTQNSKGWTPIINAAYWCRLDCLRLLLKHNADIHITNKVSVLDGRTALFEACRSPCKESGENDFSTRFDDEDSLSDGNVIKLVAVGDKTISKDSDNEAGADEDSKKKKKVKFSETSSECSELVEKDYERELADIVRSLIDNGADVNGVGGVNQDDFTPLVFAAYHGHNEIVKLLLQYSCEKTPLALYWAKNMENEEVVKTLIQNGFNLENKTEKQYIMPPPLHESQMPKTVSSSEFVRYLLNNGGEQLKSSSPRPSPLRSHRRPPVASTGVATAPLPPTSQPPPLEDTPPVAVSTTPRYENIPSIDD